MIAMLFEIIVWEKIRSSISTATSYHLLNAIYKTDYSPLYFVFIEVGFVAASATVSAYYAKNMVMVFVSAG